MVNYQMLAVLRNAGDRSWWDYLATPSFFESYKIQGTDIFNRTIAWGLRSWNLFRRDRRIWFDCGEHMNYRMCINDGVSLKDEIKKAALSFSLHTWKRINMCLNDAWCNRYVAPWGVIKKGCGHLAYAWRSAPTEVKVACTSIVVWRSCCLLRSYWQQGRTSFDGQDDIAFCAHCSPQLLDKSRMALGNAYVKRFHVPASCPRCSRLWMWRGWKAAKISIGNSHYQFLGTYTALRMQRERDVHCPVANQLDVQNEYRFAHRFMQLHAGTLGALESKRRFWYSTHTKSYCMSSQWEEIKDGDARGYTQPTPEDPDPEEDEKSVINKMRELWQFVYDNGRQLPQSTVLSGTWERCKKLIGEKLPITTTTEHARVAALAIDTRLNDTSYISPPPGLEMAPVALPSAQAVGAVTHTVTIHNSQDKASVVAALEGRSTAKKSVFADADGEYPELVFKKSSNAATRLNKFWRKFNLECLTDAAIEAAYHKLYADKDFKEIAMSKFSQDDIAAIQTELQTTTSVEKLGTRKANGKLESVVKQGKPARLVVDNTLQLLAINIISTGIFQHVLFDHQEGIFYKMSIKHRAREDVLDGFGKMMKDPFGDKKRAVDGIAPRVPDTCCWEIDQTGMELHERCSKQGEGLLGYTYNSLLRINRHISHKLNGEFTGLHEAKIVHDVKTGMRLRFRMKNPDVPKETWFTAKFPDMYLDSGWALTSGVNFMNELSGVFSSIVENPEHLFARNGDTGKFRLQDGTFDWKFKSIPLYQTLESTAPSSFTLYLRGMFEGDDGGGAASGCLADVRNGGNLGLIIKEQEDLGYSAKLKTIRNGRLEIIGAHFPVKDGLVCNDVPWIPAVQRYMSKLGVQTNVRITPSSAAARFLSLASMFAGRNEPLQRAFEHSAARIIEKHGKESSFWSTKLKTDGYTEVDRAFGDGTCCEYTMSDLQAHYDRHVNKVHQTTFTQLRMLNMSIAEDVDATTVTQDDFTKLGLFADECRTFDGDDEAVFSFLPQCFR